MGTVFLPIPVLRSWESYKKQTVNNVTFLVWKALHCRLKYRRVMDCKVWGKLKVFSFWYNAHKRFSSSCVALLQIVNLVPHNNYLVMHLCATEELPTCVKIKGKATINSGRQTICLDIIHNIFKNHVWLTARWTWGFSATPLQIDVGWQWYTEP